MISESFTSERSNKEVEIDAGLVVVGGGLAGTCAAIAAARAGLKVVLVNDRPVLGGNSSSEVRLWVLGATSHMGNNNRWAREGGIINEILTENIYRNPEGNPVIFDTVLLDKVIAEPNITLLLNAMVYSIKKDGPEQIKSVTAFCSQNSTNYLLSAPLFCDASGDGIAAFLAGAAFRMGAESREEFGEKFAPPKEYGELLGHSIYFYTKNIGKPVTYVPPLYALNSITKIPRYKMFNTSEQGCQLWWIEFGGRLDTVHDTEKIKWELWKVVFGVWSYIKNSGQFPSAENLTLEWVGTIPGKRESRRFEGDYILKQQDIVEQRIHHDAVAYGGWSLDLHPADGVFSDKPGCDQWHTKGPYQIPLRSLYSRDITNLFLAGRIISATHVAFASSRVMGTCASIGQAVGIAAALCVEKKLIPRELIPDHITELQKNLIKAGQYIPGIKSNDENDLVRKAHIQVSSELVLEELNGDGPLIPLAFSAAQMLPATGKIPGITFYLTAAENTILTIELRISSKPGNHTPDIILETKSINIQKGEHEIKLCFNEHIPAEQYIFICFLKNEHVFIKTSQQRVTGLLSVFNSFNAAVSNYGRQQPLEDIGVDDFEFWCPQRRPAGHNLAFRLDKALSCFSANNLLNSLARPTVHPNAWIADIKDNHPTVMITWNKAQAIKRIILSLDGDFDHPMETTLMEHPETVMPFCIRNYKGMDDKGSVIFEKKDNYQSRNEIVLAEVITTSQLTIQVEHPSKDIPAALFEIRCYEN